MYGNLHKQKTCYRLKWQVYNNITILCYFNWSSIAQFLVIISKLAVWIYIKTFMLSYALSVWNNFCAFYNLCHLAETIGFMFCIIICSLLYTILKCPPASYIFRLRIKIDVVVLSYIFFIVFITNAKMITNK